MTLSHASQSGARVSPSDPQAFPLDEAHWRAAADVGVRLAARQWQVPLDNITDVALADADGPCYLFRVVYTDRLGQRRTAAVHMPKGMRYTSALSMDMLWPGAREMAGLPEAAAAMPRPPAWPQGGIQ